MKHHVPTMYYASFGVTDAIALNMRGAMARLARFLRQPAVSVGCRIGALPRRFRLKVEQALLADCGDVAVARVMELLLPSLLVAIPNDHPYAQQCRAKDPRALWGAARGRTLAAVYSNFRAPTFWHEALHLLGADDCYDEHGMATCDMPNCAMRYGTMSDSLVLCTRNISLLRRGQGECYS
jgi:hypothetical protein